MQVQINSDRSVDVDEALSELVKVNVTDAMKRFGTRITRIEVHLSDVNGERSGSRDKRCLLEARPAGRDPVAVTEQAATVEEALRSAGRKMQRLLSSEFGRLDKKH
jgi:hypothetical protein